MEGRQKFLFKIEGVDLSDLPMRRVAEYAVLLSKFLGHETHVHMEGIEKGSVAFALNIDAPHARKTIQAARDASRGKGTQQSNEAYQKMNARLAEDKGVGSWRDERGNNIVPFPGRLAPALEAYGPFEQEDSFDGVVVRVGGMREDLVEIWLRSSDMRTGQEKISCLADHAMAKQLAPYLFEQELRVFGTAKWERLANGKWKLWRFVITRFEELDTTPLTALVERLRDIPGNGWEKLEDPWRELERERHG